MNDLPTKYCPICLEPKLEVTTSKGVNTLTCERCGTIKVPEGTISSLLRSIGEESADYFETYDPDVVNKIKVLGLVFPPPGFSPQASRERANASGWIRSRRGVRLEFRDVYHLPSVKPPSVHDRLINILNELALDSAWIGEKLDVTRPKYLASTWSINKVEHMRFIEQLITEGWLSNYGGMGFVTLAGYEKLENMGIKDSNQVFIAMAFKSELDEAKVSIKNAIENPQAVGKKFTAYRVDDDEDINKIDDKILFEIRRSVAIVADFTGHRGGVYFEAGYALGLNIPVIWTCRETDMKGLHFDIRQYNCIDWKDEKDLQERLARRITSVLN